MDELPSHQDSRGASFHVMPVVYNRERHQKETKMTSADVTLTATLRSIVNPCHLADIIKKNMFIYKKK